MPITLDFAQRVHRKQRMGASPARLAERLGVKIDEVMDAHRMLALPVNDTMEPIKHRTDAEREAELEKLPCECRSG